MTNPTINVVQDYLTMISDNRVKTILNVKTLLERHTSEKVVSLLQDLARQNRKTLMELIETDKTSSAINDTVATMFRLHMAISMIQKNHTQEEEATA